MSKIITIVGPTASGKSDLAVKIAREFNGEIISADSRQVYRGLNIGTGKITKKEMLGVHHHLIDVTDPRLTYTVAQYQKDAKKILRYIVRSGKIPIIVGGTGFYIDVLLGYTQIPPVPPNKKLREKLQKKNSTELFVLLGKKDPSRAQTIDPHNKVRLIRALEIINTLGKVPKLKKPKQDYDLLEIGIKIPDKKLKENITIRLFARVREGMIAEAKKLHKNGLSWKRMEELGLEYRYLSRFLRKFPQGSASSPHWSAFQTELEKEIWRYAKRQKTWFKRNKNIQWFTPKGARSFTPKEYSKIKKVIKEFLYL